MTTLLKDLTMKILITGGTGFIGQQLCSSLKAKNYDLCVLTRNVKRLNDVYLLMGSVLFNIVVIFKQMIFLMW
jgi:nucleoside-diphosphate-sugar epimerase